MYTNSFNIYSTNDLQAKYNDDIELLKDSKYPSDFMKPQVRSMHVRSYYMLAIPRIVHTPYFKIYAVRKFTYERHVLKRSKTGRKILEKNKNIFRSRMPFPGHGRPFV